MSNSYELKGDPLESVLGLQGQRDYTGSGAVTLVMTIVEGKVGFEVTFPDWPTTMRFSSGERNNLGRIPLHRPNESRPFDHARTTDEAASRLYHEARKFAYTNKGSANVHDLYRGHFERRRDDFLSQ